jgi:hypothetical protein
MAKYIEVEPTSPTLVGIVWHEHFGCYRTTVAEWLELSFSYQNDGYRVVVAGHTVKARGRDPQSAAALAVAAARIFLRKALEALPVEEVGKEVK